MHPGIAARQGLELPTATNGRQPQTTKSLKKATKKARNSAAKTKGRGGSEAKASGNVRRLWRKQAPKTSSSSADPLVFHDLGPDEAYF